MTQWCKYSGVFVLSASGKVRFSQFRRNQIKELGLASESGNVTSLKTSRLKENKIKSFLRLN